MSVILHELAHGYSALMLGDQTAKYAGRLTLNPLKHLDPVGSVIFPILMVIFQLNIPPDSRVIFGWAKPVPYNPYNLRNQKWGEAIVAIAGPLTNVLLALVFGLIIRIGTSMEALSPAVIQLSSIIVLINIVLGIFNLVPIPPLDGSKVLFTFLPFKFQAWRYQLERFGFLILLFFIFFLWRFILPLIILFFHILTGI